MRNCGEGLSTWRMPPNAYPVSAGGSDIFIIELQRQNRRTATRGLADDQQAVFTPGKMLQPILGTRIEQRNKPIGHGVGGVSLCAFIAIAKRTSEPKI